MRVAIIIAWVASSFRGCLPFSTNIFRGLPIITSNGCNTNMITCHYHCCFCALSIRVINKFIRGRRVQNVINGRRTTRKRTRLFTTARFTTQLIPRITKGRMAIRSNFRFVFQRITIIRDFYLLRCTTLVASRKMFLIRVSKNRTNALRRSINKIRFTRSRFRRNYFSATIFSFRTRTITTSRLRNRKKEPRLLCYLQANYLREEDRRTKVVGISILYLS